MKTLKISLIVAITGIALVSGANEKMGTKWTMKEYTTEERQTIASCHDKMAVCLRSTKMMKDCHEEMMGMKECEMMDMRRAHNMMDKDDKKMKK